jgi:Mg-chelatase subunit ChlD
MDIQKNSHYKLIVLAIVVCGFLLLAGIGCVIILLHFGEKAKPKVITPTGIHISTGQSGKIFTGSKGGLVAEVKLGNEFISCKQDYAYLQVTLTGEKIAQTSYINKKNLDLIIVVDRSGSMSGTKLQYVKQALISLQGLLDRNDRVTIITYDTEVSLLYSDRFDASRFENIVNKIEAGSSTNLIGGLEKGMQQVSESNEYYHKLILLSDGLANVGVSTPEGIAAIVEKKLGNLSISTIGVGSDYDEYVMTTIAKTGRGNYYFLENPQDAKQIFADELSKSLAMVAENIKVELNLGNEIQEVVGIGYDLKNSLSYMPLDIYSEKTSRFLFQIKLSDLEAYLGKSMALGNIKITYQSRVTGVGEAIVLPIEVSLVDYDLNPLADNQMYEEYMLDVYAQNLWQVDLYLNSKENAKARQLLDETYVQMQSGNQRLAGNFDKQISSLEQKQRFLSELQDRYINEDAVGKNFKKSNQADSYNQLYSR